MLFKIKVKVFLIWLCLNAFYLFVLTVDGNKFATGFFMTPATIKTVLINVFLWTFLSIFLYRKVGELIDQKRSFNIMLAFFLVNLLWLPLFIYLNHFFLLLFALSKIPSMDQITGELFYIFIYINVIQYLFLFSLCYGLNYQQHAFQIEMKTAANKLAYSDMTMRTLQSQLSPHFLYNALSSISGLVRRSEKHKTLDLIADLGELLRFSINASQVSLIGLNEEIHFTEKYIDLQKIRFGEKYNVELNKIVEDELLMCPPFILQTLVENAFVHSNHPGQQAQQIQVIIKIVNQQLMFQVTNNQAASPNTNNFQGMGMAIKNLDRRLAILFSENYQIDQQEISGQYQTTVLIPINQDEA